MLYAIEAKYYAGAKTEKIYCLAKNKKEVRKVLAQTTWRIVDIWQAPTTDLIRVVKENIHVYARFYTWHVSKSFHYHSAYMPIQNVLTYKTGSGDMPDTLCA